MFRRTLPLACLALTACAQQVAAPPPVAAASPLKPLVTLQDMMGLVVDPSADVVWGATGQVVDAKGSHDLSPKNDEEWLKVRASAVMLLESTNLLMIEGRHVASKDFPADSDALGSQEIQTTIDGNRVAFNGFAEALREVAQQILVQVDAKNVEKLMELGGTLDDVCETCHTTFWYPPKKKA